MFYVHSNHIVNCTCPRTAAYLLERTHTLDDYNAMDSGQPMNCESHATTDSVHETGLVPSGIG